MRKRLINLPNFLTAFRIVVLPLLAVLIAQGKGVGACLVLAVAGLTDILDGWIARVYRQETAIGKLMDPVADKILLCVATVFLVARPIHPLDPMLATLLLAREFLVTGLRAIAATEGLVIGAGQTGKIKTVTQFFGIGAIMLGIGNHTWGPDAHRLGVISLWVSVVLSYASMIQYLRMAFVELKSKLS